MHTCCVVAQMVMAASVGPGPVPSSLPPSPGPHPSTATTLFLHGLVRTWHGVLCHCVIGVLAVSSGCAACMGVTVCVSPSHGWLWAAGHACGLPGVHRDPSTAHE